MGDGVSTPFDGLNVWRALAARAAAQPDDDFLVWVPDDGPERRWTYLEFEQVALKVANGLAGRGVRPGDRVIIHLENCPEFLLTWFACAAMGAVAVTTNPRASAVEFAYFAEHSAAVGVVTQPRLLGMVGSAGPGWAVAVAADPVGAERSDVTVAAPESFSSLLVDGPGPVIGASRPGDLMNVLYTSGTTSRPKGVRWTHANALWGGRVSALHEGLTRRDVHLVYLPLFHLNGMCCQVLATLAVGGTAVLVPKWSTSRFWQTSLAHGCTWLPLVPFTTQALRGMDSHPHSTYRAFSARAVDSELARRFGVRMDGWFGMTETVTQVVHSDPWGSAPTGAIGRAALEYGIRVALPDGAPAEPGEAGQLLVGGRPGLSLFAGYLDDDVATAAAFGPDGWFRTGDVVRQDEDGVIRYVERLNDIIKVGGENVAPAEIEQVIAGLDGVAEVAVVSRPHPMLDEVPVAFVTLHAPQPGVEARVLELCEERLASYKTPRAVFVVDALPKTTIGKVRKVALRAQAIELSAAVPSEAVR